MCGITGIWGEGSDSVIKAMTDGLSHRGPDHGAIWQDQAAGLTLGHRRLSIIDLSKDGHQPMVSPSGRFVMVYNGEIYNYRSLRADLGDEGFTGHSDSEVLLATVETYGLADALKRVEGMFAFAIWDRHERQLYLARDRMGQKPLYYGWAGRALIFGSELKALAAHPDFKRDISRPALQGYLQTGYISAPHTIYKDAQHLMPGQYAVIAESDIKAKAIKAQTYWSARDTALAAQANRVKDADEAQNMVHEHLRDAVKKRLVADVPLGTFLSGGVDSSLVTALMQEATDRPVQTFTIGFEEDGYDEAGYARKVAKALGADHHELYLNATEAMQVIPQLPKMYDEPFADISAIPTHLVSAYARQYVTVALSGDGGDELFGGYNRHILGPTLWRRMSMMPKGMRQWMARKIIDAGPKFWTALRPKAPQFAQKMMKLAKALGAESESTLYTGFLNTWDDDLMRHSERSASVGEESQKIHSPRERCSLAQDDNINFAEAMMLADTLGYLPNDILTKVDRASMAVGLEARAPFMDHALFEAAWRTPLDQKVKNGQGKHILRQILGKYMPAALMKRPKAGFTMPIGPWLRGPLRDWAEGLLDPKAIEQHGYLDTATITTTWQEHLSGRADHGHKLWIILMWQAWCKEWLEVT